MTFKISKYPMGLSKGFGIQPAVQHFTLTVGLFWLGTRPVGRYAEGWWWFFSYV